MPTDQFGVDTPHVVVGGGLRDEGVAASWVVLRRVGRLATGQTGA